MEAAGDHSIVNRKPFTSLRANFHVDSIDIIFVDPNTQWRVEYLMTRLLNFGFIKRIFMIIT